jgi:hypothetical protein
MEIDRIYHVSFRPPEVEDWPATPADRTAAYVRPETAAIPEDRLGRLSELWTYGLKTPALESLLGKVDLTLLSIAHTHAAELDFLRAQPKLRGLAINWNTKVRTLDFLRGMASLEILSLQDMKHVHDLEPLSGLADLRGLQIAGGMDSKMDLATLAPLAGLVALEDLRLAAVRIGDGSLDVLANLPRLKRLTIALNAAPMEAYARLSALAPHIACDALQPYIPTVGGPLPRGADPIAAADTLGDSRVMVVGKGQPMLRARTDRVRLIKCCARFQEVRSKMAL